MHRVITVERGVAAAAEKANKTSQIGDLRCKTSRFSIRRENNVAINRLSLCSFYLLLCLESAGFLF
jgi:hypothetical protein